MKIVFALVLVALVVADACDVKLERCDLEVGLRSQSGERGTL